MHKVIRRIPTEEEYFIRQDKDRVIFLHNKRPLDMYDDSSCIDREADLLWRNNNSASHEKMDSDFEINE